jgi:hypothetical protein
MTPNLLLLLLALICFIVSASKKVDPWVDATALGLAFWVLSLLIGGR